MNIHFLGTGAGEGIPALFCRCGICNTARHLGGHDVRSRTSVLIDEVLKVDFPPDTWYHVVRDNIDLCKVRDLIFTHSHSDHLNDGDVRMRLSAFSNGCDAPLKVYGSDTVITRILARIGADKDRHLIPLALLRPFETVTLETAVVTPLLADHAPLETCLLFHIERGGKRLLYGNDTGWFPEATWGWIEAEARACRPFDGVILDCTHGADPVCRNHMGVATIVKIRQRLLHLNCLRHGGGTPVYATHFSHNGRMSHAALVEALAPHSIGVAYDGMRVKL